MTLPKLREVWKALPSIVKLTILGAVVVMAAAAGAWWSGRRSDFPAWLEALGTIGALVAAVLAARYAAGTFQIENERDRRWQEAEESSQAARVSVWYEHAESDGDDQEPEPSVKATSNGPDEFARDTLPIGALHIRNASDLPVADATVSLLLRWSEGLGEQKSKYAGTEFLGLVPPSPAPRRRRLSDHSVARLRQLWPEGWSTDSVHVDVEFVFADSAGRQWIRRTAGELVKWTAEQDVSILAHRRELAEWFAVHPEDLTMENGTAIRGWLVETPDLVDPAMRRQLVVLAGEVGHAVDG